MMLIVLVLLQVGLVHVVLLIVFGKFIIHAIDTSEPYDSRKSSLRITYAYIGHLIGCIVVAFLQPLIVMTYGVVIACGLTTAMLSNVAINLLFGWLIEASIDPRKRKGKDGE